MINRTCPRGAEDWAPWQWELAEKLMLAIRQRSYPRKGKIPHVEITIIGRGNNGREAREWSVFSVERSEQARIVQH